MSDKTAIGKFVKKFMWIYLFTILLLFVVVGKIIHLQYFDKEKLSLENTYKKVDLLPVRGTIFSHDGKPLAITLPSYEIYMDVSVVDDSIFKADVGKLSDSLSSFFKDKTPRQYTDMLTKLHKNNDRYERIGNKPVSHEDIDRVRKFPIFSLGQYKGGMIVETMEKRDNPYGSLAKRTIGQFDDNGPTTGIELQFDHQLKGEKGAMLTQKVTDKQYIPVLAYPKVPAKDGCDIQTTIDVYIQEAAEMALKERLEADEVFEGGTAVVMEVETGAIRAIANLYKTKQRGFDEAMNYAVRRRSEPGSTMKLVSLICLLEDGFVTLDTPIDGGDGKWKYEGVNFTDTHRGGYGMLNVQQAFEKSSNVCFGKLIAEHYKDDPFSYLSRVHNMKFTERIGLGIDGEVSSVIYSPEDKIWTKSSLPMMGIGYSLEVTPLQTLTLYNAIANGGKMMKPYLVENFRKEGKIEKEFKPQIISGSVCSKNTIKEVKKALRGVVENGTATICMDERYAISGKTGTAQIAFDNRGYKDAQGFKRHQASFVGFFPSEKPKYSCIVVMYTNKTKSNFYGGSWACPVFKTIADKIFATHPEWKVPLSAKGIKPADNPSIAAGRAKEGKSTLALLPSKEVIGITTPGWIEIVENEEGTLYAQQIEIKDGYVPNVINMGLKDALCVLENEGYRVSFKGKGRVSSQYPPAGTPLGNKGKVELELID